MIAMEVQTLRPHVPQLPIELVLHILQLTASISPTSAASVALVSSWARKIALPYLFTTLIRRSRPWTSVELSSMVKSLSGMSPARWRPPMHCGCLVRHMWTENVDIASRTDERALFLSCPNIEDLVLAPLSLRALADALLYRSSSTEQATDCPTFAQNLWSLTLTVHTFRYDWHPLVDVRLANGSVFLHNITHLRILDMKISSYVPHAHLPNLTHVALPYLDLMPNIGGGILRVPDRLLDHPSLQVLVLTLDEGKWLGNPWYHTALHAMPGSHTKGASGRSPRETFRELVRWTKKKDERIYVVLSPRVGREDLDEWVEAARGGRSILDKATNSRTDDSYGCEVPDVFPKVMLRW